MAKKKLPSGIEITELFLVRADWTRTFMGEIRRNTDPNGNPILTGKVIINHATAWSCSTDEEELRMNMDAICVMILDYALHADSGASDMICNMKYFRN
jgi:hypothetical protein